jgi:dTDP-4-amino-4,6-dideoxygalactose transaminase
MDQIPFNRADISEIDRIYISKSIENGHISGNGSFGKLAEKYFEESLLVRRSLLTTSCTHALEMCALLLNLKDGDEVIVPSFTFVSTASAFLMHGAKPVFVDVDDATLNIDPKSIEAAITSKTRAVCVVHYAGIAVDLDAIQTICDRHGIVLIEDNAHGLFSTYKEKSLGSFGSLATLSFHETKNITCGEGGALLINEDSFIERAEILREKGTDRSRFLRGQVDKYTWVDLGSSWVISDILAAVLMSQLERSEEIQKKRRFAFDYYERELSSWAVNQGFRRPVVPKYCQHSSHMYFLRLQGIEQRDRFIDHLKGLGISAVFHYQPLHLSQVGKSLGGRVGQCPVSEEAGNCLVRLPLFSLLSESQLEQIASAVTSFKN